MCQSKNLNEEHISMNNKLRAIAIGAITAIAGIGVGAIGTEIASAHANAIAGTAACQTNGTYTVTWTVGNDWPLPETVSLNTYTGGGSLSGLPASIGASNSTPYMTASVTQSGVPGAVTEATLTVNGTWPDYSQSDIGTVNLAGTCNQVTAGTLGYTEPTCASPTAAAVILPSNTPNVTYTTTGTVAPGSTVTTTATANTGFVITGTTVFAHTFNAAPADCTILVTPVAPTVVTTTACGVKDTFSTNGPAGVIYTPASGSLNAGQTITVVATAASGYTITPEARTTFTLTGGTVETCTTETTAPATTTTVPATTTTVPATTTTVPATTTTVPETTTTTTTTVPAVVVEAPTTPTTQVAQVLAPVPVTEAPLAVGDIIAPAAPATGLPSTGTSSTLVLLLGGLLLAAGAGMLAVVRRRALK
jgi:LPXTG-motif cell wall-anchored protein